MFAAVWASLQRFLARPAARAAAANFGWLAAEKTIRLALGVVVGFWVARYLGPVRLGSLGYCSALVALLGFIPGLGLDAVVKLKLLEAPERTAEVLASSFWLRLGAGTLAYVGVLAAAAAGWGLQGEERRVFATVGLLLFQPAWLIPDLWLQAHLRARMSVAAQVAGLAVASAVRIWLIVTNASIEAFAGAMVLEAAVSAIGVFVVARRSGLRFAGTAARVATMRRLLAEAWPLLFASLAILVYMKIDEVMLRHMAGAAAVGVYSAAARLSEIWYFLPTALASSLLPALLRARSRGGEDYARRLQGYFDVSAAAAYVLSIPIALAAPWIIRVAYGPKFIGAGPILAVHIWSSIFVFLGVARSQWLVNERLQRFYLGTVVVGAVANIALNWFFIPWWGGLGAAYATVISYALAAWLASYAHPAVRPTAGMQTRALLIPLRGWAYLRAR